MREAATPTRPIHSGEHHIKTASSLLTSKLHPSSLSATFHSFELKLGSPLAAVPTPKSLSASPPHASPISPPTSTCSGRRDNTLWRKRLYPEQHCEHLFHQNSGMAKLLSRQVCHVNVALGAAAPSPNSTATKV